MNTVIGGGEECARTVPAQEQSTMSISLDALASVLDESNSFKAAPVEEKLERLNQLLLRDGARVDALASADTGVCSHAEVRHQPFLS